jgi:hypothetical protein
METNPEVNLENKGNQKDLMIRHEILVLDHYVPGFNFNIKILSLKDLNPLDRTPEVF